MTVVFENVSFTYGRASWPAPWVLKDIELTIPDGQFFVLLGPSGCGKSTLLRLIAGFDRATVGKVMVNAAVIEGPGRDRGMIFQDFDSALYPWMTVRENVEFGLKLAGAEPRERRVRCEDVLRMVNLSAHADKFQSELSGGMKQRVQIARMLAMHPSIMLMDEPFAALDAQTRRTLQKLLIALRTEVYRTVVYVTHDIREALNLGERIAVMSAGPAATIKSQYDVPLSFPRDEADPIYTNLHRRLDDDIEVEVKRAWS